MAWSVRAAPWPSSWNGSKGEDLSQRVARGAISIDEALAIIKQVAAALEAGHEQGIVHRDLKPANIRIKADGTLTVLDYGLAKAMEAGETGGAGGAGEAGRLAALSQAPTMTNPDALSQPGMILGTPAYMSPEQASGKPVDKRADIWSFGVVLWEMLTGRRLFDGETMSHTLADVLRGPIDFSQFPEGTPKPIRDLLRRCLTRDVKKRLRDIGEARLLLEEVSSGADEVRGEPSRSGRPGGARSRLPHARARRMDDGRTARTDHGGVELGRGAE